MGIHPSEEGYNKMAKAWYDAIDSLPAEWIVPAREPDSEAPWAWYMQQRTACNALKGMSIHDGAARTSFASVMLIWIFRLGSRYVHHRPSDCG
jgi:hypothetical protein